MPNAQPVETTTDNKHKDLGLVIINVFGPVSLDLAKPTTIIDHHAPVEKGEMTDKYTTKDFILTSTLNLTFDPDL